MSDAAAAPSAIPHIPPRPPAQAPAPSLPERAVAAAAAAMPARERVLIIRQVLNGFIASPSVDGEPRTEAVAIDAAGLAQVARLWAESAV